ncbi:ABC transporter substrate-binding protein [Alicyclobacillus vulcanalis]|uniref:Carbohydrate ABC transporter substrate-binding protein, CUT1 family n=1 Tax=Alicyclobacillus vulcanalis TaxID=252246 RepID=A0A1N7PGE2_9BACL|nr:extracellular solute-binding protein [Alicyclobacillus vulcanalis]SIT09600.1 carbohydrate ABC transporter substrate-binding protein, CUT1 family [Alicyclobacillus vulcanalis]
MARTNYVRVGVVAGFVAAAVAGCGVEQSNNSDVNQTNGAASSNPVVLTMWDLTSGKSADQAIISQFERLHPNIRIQLDTFAVDAIKQQEKVAASSHSLPDIFFDWGGTLASYYESNGLALNLNSYAQKYGWYQRFSPAAIKFASYNGKLYMVPVTLNGLELYYRKDIFEKYGLKPPTTFSELEHVCNVLVQHSVSPFGLGGINHWYTMRYFEAILYHEVGAQGMSQLMNLQGNWDSPRVIQAYALFRQWVKKNYFIPGFMSINEDQDINQFMTGKVAMLLTGPWLDEQLMSDGFSLNKAGVFPFPEDQRPNELIGFAQGFYIASNSKHPKEAAEFLNFYTSKATLQHNSKILAGPYANQSVPPTTPNAAKILADMKKDGSYLIGDQALPQPLVESLWQAEDSVALGRLSPEQAAQFMQESVSSYKSQNQ